MNDKITVNIAVDVIKALSEKSLDNSLYMMDDSPWGSCSQGTPQLCTSCMPGQTIHWAVYPLDLQTSVAIRGISFRTCGGECELPEENPGLKTWTGVVPCMEKGHRYVYRLTLQMGHGVHGVMSVDTPSLVWACPVCCNDNDLKEESYESANNDCNCD